MEVNLLPIIALVNDKFTIQRPIYLYLTTSFVETSAIATPAKSQIQLFWVPVAPNDQLLASYATVTKWKVPMAKSARVWTLGTSRNPKTQSNLVGVAIAPVLKKSAVKRS